MNNKCKTVIRSTAVTVVGANLQVVIPAHTFSNLQELELIVCQNIPVTPTDIPVVINNGGTLIPLLNKCGNVLRISHLDCRKKYCAVFGNDTTAHILIKSPTPRVCCRCVTSPTSTVVVTP